VEFEPYEVQRVKAMIVTGFRVDGPRFIFVKVNVTSAAFAREKRVREHQTYTVTRLYSTKLLDRHPLNGPLSGTTRVSRYQKGKTSLDLLKQEIVSGSGIDWAICKSAPRPDR